MRKAEAWSLIISKEYLLGSHTGIATGVGRRPGTGQYFTAAAQIVGTFHEAHRHFCVLA